MTTTTGPTTKGPSETTRARVATTDTTTSLDARPRRPGFSVRARLTVAVSLLVALALGAAGLIVFAVQGDRTQERITLEVEQELAEFTRLQSRGIDPATGCRTVAQRALRPGAHRTDGVTDNASAISTAAPELDRHGGRGHSAARGGRR